MLRITQIRVVIQLSYNIPFLSPVFVPSSTTETMTTQNKRIFMTGASGYVGSVITELAIADGYDVYGLCRSEASEAKLRNLGGVPIHGDLTSIDILRRESATADIIIHLATAYVFGGPPYEEVMHIDTAAIDAMAEPLMGTDKPLVITSGTLLVAPDPSGAETTEDSPPTLNPLVTRGKADQHAFALISKGVRVISIRLAPFVYGRGGSGVRRFMGMAAQTGGMTCIDGSRNHTTVVHVDDAARLYLLAAEKGKPGDIFNASSSTDVTAREMFEAMASAIGVPIRDITSEEAVARMGPVVAGFLKAENRASGAKARKELGWQPKGMGILDEINKGSYQAVAKEMRKTK